MKLVKQEQYTKEKISTLEPCSSYSDIQANETSVMVQKANNLRARRHIAREEMWN